MLRDWKRAVCVLIAATAACGPFYRSDTPNAVVLFNNQSLNQADVYAVRTGGPQIRIGSVIANRREALRVPSSLTGAGSDVTIVARTLASNRVSRSGPVSLVPGDTIEVTLAIDERALTVLPPRNP
jgi:hypothetical protein